MPDIELLRSSINKQDMNLQTNIDMTDSMLTQLYSLVASISSLLQGQSYWDNNKKISEDLFKTYFNMSINLARQIMKLDELDKTIEQLKDQNSIAPPQRDAQNY